MSKYNNSFGNGPLEVGETIRELKRWAEPSIFKQRQILENEPTVVLSQNNQQVYSESGEPVYD